jgi:hypothetical protein
MDTERPSSRKISGRLSLTTITVIINSHTAVTVSERYTSCQLYTYSLWIHTGKKTKARC